MTTFIWILAWLPLVLPAMSALPRPVNVKLTSKHFIHVLTWEPGPGTPAAVHYSVSIMPDTEISSVPVAGCQRVRRPLLCNLTSAFSIPDQRYFIQVKAVLGAKESQPGSPPQEAFCPETDTVLDLPLLTVTSCGPDLCVDLQPPLEHLRERYDSLNYKLRIQSNNAAPLTRDTTSLGRVVLEDVAPGSEFCVSVCFSDQNEQRESNYSQPVCAVTPGHYNADPWIAAVLCILVVCGVVCLAMLVPTGFICLKRSLPSVLTSIHHLEEALFVPSCRSSPSSLLNVRPTAPPSGGKRSSQTSDESDEESVTEVTGGSRRGRGYEEKAGASTSSSSSSLSGPNVSSKQTPDVRNPETEPWILTETHSTDELKEEEVVREEEEEDVDLLTLTFGRYGDEEEQEVVVEVEVEVEVEEEKPHSDMAEVDRTSPTLPSQTRDTEEVAIETVSCSDDDDEEEEEEHSGYMGRP